MIPKKILTKEFKIQLDSYRELADKIAKDWSREISNIEVDKYSKTIDTITFMPIYGHKYTSSGNPTLVDLRDAIASCFKVCFTFYGYPKIHDNRVTKPINITEEKWNSKLEQLFLNKLKSTVPFRGVSTGEWRLENDKADYFINQGHRFIVQFYPNGVLKSIRNDKINDILK